MSRLLIVVSLIAAGCGPPESPAPRPNVIVMFADDLGWNDVGFHDGQFATPNLDRLAAGGIELNRFYTWPVCTPTRAALVTGRSPVRLGTAYSVLKPWLERGLPLEERILPQPFAEAGYRTAALGKWHLGAHAAGYLPRSRGFDHFYGHLNGFVDYFDHTIRGGIDWQRNGETLDEGGYATDLVAAEAKRLIGEWAEHPPFFMYIAFNAPHPPLQAPDTDVARYARFERPEMQTLGGMVHALDRAVGTVLEALERHEIADETIVLFFSDNGGLRARRENLPLRGGKGTTFEGGIRVPAAIRWPGRLAAQTRSDQVVRVEDVFPTLCVAARLACDDIAFDGQSVWHELVSGENTPREPFFVAVETASAVFETATDGRWKVVERTATGSTFAEVMLFDVQADPGEEHDLASRHPEIVERLRRVVEANRASYPPDGLRYSAGPPEGWAAPPDWNER